MRERLVVGNWKMNPPNIADAVELARGVAARAYAGVAVGVAPPAVALAAVADALRGGDVAVYTQDVHWEERGAFTGQIASSMLSGLASGAIVGHSEVRRDQCDDDARVAKKLARAVAAGLRPLLCVGESAAEHGAGEATAVVARQIELDLAGAARRGLQRLVVAYEPIWAIGTGNPATGDHASAAARAVRAALKRAGLDADAIPVLYGGSVSARSVAEFARADGIDGALVGGASLDPDEFSAIVHAFG
ncbi:MAG TPA: triose-phosphate isomerase [Candidatus Limnocylindria bacterium]|nr:triose-phosphate isomerase [Candidatus Limnocylindria bacterium]